MSEKKEVIRLSLKDGLFQLMWLMDKDNPVHLRYSVKLDSDVNEELLCNAWEKTKEVYPIIKCVPVVEGYDIVLYDDESKNNDKPIKSKVAIMPGSDLVCNKMVCVTFYKNEISLSSFHTLLDGGGITEVFRTLLYFYLSSVTGKEDANPIVCTKTGRKIDEYYYVMDKSCFENYNPVALTSYPYGDEFFVDEEIALDGNKIVEGSIKFPSDDFIKYCKANGATPVAMLSILLAKAAYKLNPNETRNVAYGYTVSTRKSLELEGYISNLFTGAISYVTYEGTKDEGMKEMASLIRSTLNSQRTVDYIKTFRQNCMTYNIQQFHKFATLTYMGRLDIGENTKHIIDFNMGTNAFNNCYMMDMNGEFYIMLQFGKSTDKYLDAIKDVLAQAGIKADVYNRCHELIPDVLKPVE